MRCLYKLTLNYVLVVRKAEEADLPPWLIGKMVFNNVMSAVGGVVPVVGDIVIAVYKANSRNARGVFTRQRRRVSQIAGGGGRGNKWKNRGKHKWCFAKGHGAGQARSRHGEWTKFLFVPVVEGGRRRQLDQTANKDDSLKFS
ncbi:hypothetical protein L210DRAFT_3572804 [Boletus edulis BED1]|uniref:Uncharacterized protein n=1 Tax=Boletus edulis BED1 TaxID=1328754 RepID=A0AAD4BDM8_BOLED|nr:hypothetical protein L210DRAFT_3572804 [Boletus edulis BED1]